MTINPQADELVTRVLIGLRDTEAPRGLENRIAARIAARQAQAAEARSNAPRIPFAGFWLYATAATVLAVLSLIGVSLRHQPQTTANVASTQVPQGFRLGSHSSAKEEGASAPAPAKTQAVQGFSPHISQGPTKTLVPQGFSLGSHNPAKEGGVLTPLVDDPDTIALAETLAPSRPAPPMPLTAQEQLLLAATRRGQPIEVAELDLLRAPALRSAAEARERSNLRQFAQSLLGPLAAAEALNPDPPPNP